MKVAVLMGGISGEREVSLASGIQVVRALREAGHEVFGVDTSHGVLTEEAEGTLLSAEIREPLPAALSQDLLATGNLSVLAQNFRIAEADIVFLALHGGGGEDGTVQTLLELAGIPFVGSDRVGCTLAMDKDLSKRLFRDAGVPTPPWITIQGEEEGHRRLEEVMDRFGLPLIVKPVSGGSTLGLSLAHDGRELASALEVALAHEDRVLFETYVAGREVTVGILGGQALPVGEIIPDHELFDYACKYRPGMAKEIFPAELEEDVARSTRDAALVAHRALRLRDFSRIDFILGEDGTPWCLEANALPGLTGNSLLPKAAQAAGISFPELCHRVAEMGLRRWRVMAGRPEPPGG
jgi:D-alanine-D-alanine ligase